MEDRHLFDKIWEATKDISVKVSRKAEKHWKVNTLRVEIASLRHRIGVKHRELGRFVYDAIKYQTVNEADYKGSVQGLYQEIKEVEEEIADRELRIESLEEEFAQQEELNEQELAAAADGGSDEASSEPAKSPKGAASKEKSAAAAESKPATKPASKPKRKAPASKAPAKKPKRTTTRRASSTKKPAGNASNSGDE